MKALVRNLSLVMCLLLSLFVAAQKPPGTVRLKPSKIGIKHAMFIDKKEITIIAWIEYLSWTSRIYGSESAEYKAILPDSLICLEAYPLETYPENWKCSGYWKRNEYWSYPIIVGITYEQAIEYCKWRTDRVNENLKRKKKNYTVSYSLPTEADLKEAYEQYKITYYYPYEPPVNELIAEKTVMIKGWRLSFEPYEEASATIGFRCVAEIHKYKKIRRRLALINPRF